MSAPRGRYAAYFKDERKWRHTGDKGIFHDAERMWRSEYTSVGKEHLDETGFRREPTADPPPDRGGWSVRGLKTSYRTKGHDKDIRSDFVDEGAKKSWHTAIYRDPSALKTAPRSITEDREARIYAALAALKSTETALFEAASKLGENRSVMLDLLYQDFVHLKVTAEQLRGDRRYLIHDIHADLGDLRARAKDLEHERKELLAELADEIQGLDNKSESVKTERDDALVDLRKNRQTIEARMEDLKSDPKLKWIRTHWDGLEHLHQGLLDDREMIVAQVMRYWPGLNYVAKHVRDDRKILLEAVQPHLAARTVDDVASHRSESYHTCEAILDVVMEDATSIETMEKKMRQSRTIVNQVIKDDWSNLEKAANIMRADRALVVAVVENTMVDGRC